MGARTPWSWNQWNVLSQDIQDAYEDLCAPKRAFALTVARRQPYRDLIDGLSAIADLTDDTDINCDVCFSYVVESQRLHFVRLSMVGLYATVARVKPCGGVEYISPQETSFSEVERGILRLLKTHGFHVLSEDQLNSAVDLALPEIRHAKVYNALFSPEEELPLKA